ncbi:LOW QUALITY PROTEIN: uncharacterized protein Cpr12A [Eurosta solidaginis]|uniref:LOW QUALITY PROTEIN: uncharacterized protein Cpr12A n=1 Tax=Eurosta solidaginis TaxID=178769 RepID=UPI0035311CE4
MCRLREVNTVFTLLTLCCYVFTYAQAAIGNNSQRSNNQYTTNFQQQQQQQSDTTSSTYSNNQNQFSHNNHVSSSSGIQQQQHPHQEPVTEKHVLDRFNHRFPDGSYEFRNELADGTARYERGYFLIFDKVKTLVVVGYYSYRQSDGSYLTVFYNADQNGNRQNQSITPQVYPNLPRSIEVPKFKETTDYATEGSNKFRT